LAKKKGKSRSRPSDKKWVAVFQPEFVEDLRFWVKTNRKVALRALDLVDAIVRDPFSGIGPVVLGHDASPRNTGLSIWNRTAGSTSYKADTIIEVGKAPYTSFQRTQTAVLFGPLNSDR